MSDYVEFFRTLYKESFTEKPKSKDDRILGKSKGLRDTLGYSHIAYVDVCENAEGKRIKRPYKYMSARTYQTFFGYISNENALWYTPNTLCTSKALSEFKLLKIENGSPVFVLADRDYDFDSIPHYDESSSVEGELYKIRKGGRSEKNVRWLNAFYVDIDKKNLSVPELLKVINFAHLPSPTVINETTNGFHIYWIFKKRMPATPRCTKLYKHIIKNILLSLKGIDGVDNKLTDTCRYMQIPRNIKYYDYVNLPEFDIFKSWLNQHGINNYKVMNNNKKYPRRYVPLQLNELLISQKSDYFMPSNIEFRVERAVNVILQGVKRTNRNSACFCLACYYKNKGYSREAARQLLLEWNGLNEDSELDHGDAAVISCLNSVYNSVKMGLPYKQLQALSGVCLAGWIKFKKPRPERSRSHYKEWISDIINKLIKSKNKFISGSQKELAAYFGVPLSTFKLLLKRICTGNLKAFSLNVSGKGRNAVTTFSLNMILFRKNIERFIEEFTELIEPVVLEGLDQVILDNASSGGIPF